ncbi:MAG: hypothetical protein R3E09_03890 [Novosphingobium sp.]
MKNTSFMMIFMDERRNLGAPLTYDELKQELDLYFWRVTFSVGLIMLVAFLIMASIVVDGHG